MVDSNWLFLYTPIPYLVVMYFVAYRHDLTRLVKPFRDRTGSREWWSVCEHLGLVTAEVQPPPKPFMRASRNLLLVVASVVICAIPFLFPSPLSWYFACAAQAAAAVPLFITIIMNWTGPFPFKLYRDVLPYPRLSSRVRHLGRAPNQKRREPRGRPAPASAGSS